MKLYLTNRFFTAALAAIGLVLLSYSYGSLYWLSVAVLVALLLVALYEMVAVYLAAKQLAVYREVTAQWSMGDTQPIEYTIINKSARGLAVEVTDELPYQLQYRDSILKGTLDSASTTVQEHNIRPTERGVYNFGKLHTFVSLPKLSLIQLRKSWDVSVKTAVYPSVIQMKNMELQVFSQTANLMGIRKVREIGENDEFEQIRDYVVGDNLKSINWKATSRRGELMVNQYENSKSQQIYCIIDKGRAMKMPFHGLTLLDHSINTALVTSNIILRKYDKIGLLTYGSKVGAIINADAQKGQLQKITKALYDQSTDFAESNIELIYHTIQQRIRRRSILLLFTNFEHVQDMRRRLRYLKSLGKKHLLVVIFFTNAEIEKVAEEPATTVDQLYFKTMAQESIMAKQRIVTELKRNGVQVILSKPEDLSVNTINKYLEIKARRMK